jgi:RNA recognition motif-containing protein
MNIYIGNLSYDLTEEQLKNVFEAFGYVDKAKIIKDKFTGDSKGFGFVEMPNKGEAEKALQEIKEINGKSVTINEARPQQKSNFVHTRESFSAKRSYGQRRDRKY